MPVPWNDTDWIGRVRAAPGAVHPCSVLKYVKESENEVVGARPQQRLLDACDPSSGLNPVGSAEGQRDDTLEDAPTRLRV